MNWLKRNSRDDEHVTFTDVTSSYSVLGVMGPESASLLEKVGPEGVNRMSLDDFPFATSRTVGIGSI